MPALYLAARGVADEFRRKSSLAAQAIAALRLELGELGGVEPVERAVMERSMTSP
jgi:hypothetical protein